MVPETWLYCCTAQPGGQLSLQPIHTILYWKESVTVSLLLAFGSPFLVSLISGVAILLFGLTLSKFVTRSESSHGKRTTASTSDALQGDNGGHRK